MTVAIVLLGRIGDMILSTPVFSALKKKYPNSKLTVICGKTNLQIIESNPNIDECIVFSKTPIGLVKLFLKLKFKKFDFWIDPKDHKSRECILLAKISNANTKIGFDEPNNKVFDILIPSSMENFELHFTERIFQAFEHLNIKSESLKPELFETEPDASYSDTFLNGLSKKKVFLNISATNQDRIISAKNWINILKVIDFNKYDVILSFQPAQKEIAVDILGAYNYIKEINNISLGKIISLIKRCDLVISPDTSIVHIASAFSKRTIALYNDIEDNFKKFKPISDNAVIIKQDNITNLNDIDTQLIQKILLDELNTI